jgi:hypothetical protein
MANTLLKIGARHGLTLYDIGKILYRPEYEDIPSKLEALIEKTSKIHALISKISRSKISKDIEIKPSYCEFKIKSLDQIKDYNKILEESNEVLKNLNSPKKKISKDKRIISLGEEGEDNVKENNSFLIDINVNIKEEIKQNDAPNKQKRCSLLKRTLSEPELIKVRD